MVKDETGIIANQWLKFLRDQYNLKLVDNNHINLITPITDSFDDSITLMISKKDGLYTVSDQGYTIWNLETKNINVTKKIKTKFNIEVNFRKRTCTTIPAKCYL